MHDSGTSSFLTMRWWHRQSAVRALESWTRPLIGTRPYTPRFEVGKGSYMDFGTQEIVVDPSAWDFLKVADHLPLWWNGKRIATEAQLQWRYARTAARHEVMHVLFSVSPDCSGALHFLVNALEDEWIEQLSRFFYPAAWGDFVTKARVITHYYPLDDLRTRTREAVLLNACLYHRWDWKRERGTPSRYRFHSSEDEQFWAQTIRPLVEKSWRTHEDAGRKEIAREILQLIGVDEAADLSGEGLLVLPAVLDIKGERGEDDQPLRIETALPAAVEDDEGKQGASGEAGGEGQADSDVSGRGGGASEGSTLPTRALVTIVTEDDEAPSPLTAAEELYLLPPAYLENQVRAMRSRLLRELIVSTPDAGDEESPWAGQFSVEDFLRTGGARPFLLPGHQAPAHEGLAVGLLIDRTGSMEGWGGMYAGGSILGMGGLDERGVFCPSFYDPRHRMTYARQVAMLFELTCPLAGIQLLIGAVGDYGPLLHLARDVHSTDWRAPHRFKPDQPITWLRGRNTPRDSEVTRAAIAGLYGSYGCERVSSALQMTARELAACRARTRLIIFIHDGEPTDESPEDIQRVLSEIRREGMLVVAPYVGEQSEIKLLQNIFGIQWTIPVKELSGLAKRLGRLLKRYARM